MRLNVPFYSNSGGDGNQCMQVAMNCVFKYYLEKDFSLDELDKRTRRGPNEWTTTYQIIPTLHDEGLNVRYYTNDEITLVLGGESFYRKYFGEQSDYILSKINVNVVVESVQKLLTYDLFEKRILTFVELENHLKNNHIPLVTLDWNIIKGKDGPYKGHFVPIVGFDAQYFYVHDSGPTTPTPFLPISKELFKRAWDAKGADNDAIIVYGNREKK
jgi:hypothetical protein